MASVEKQSLDPANIPSYVKRSFKNGKMKRVKLKPGMLLFAVSHKPTFHANGEVPAFWSPYKHFEYDKGFDARVDALSALTGSDRQAVFSDLSAFFGKKPGGRYAIVGKLLVPATAMFGPIRRQGKSAAQIAAASGGGAANSGAAAASAPGSGKNLIGYQFYIPGLEADKDIKRVKKIDLMNL